MYRTRLAQSLRKSNQRYLGTISESKSRITIALYRQLLGWSKSIDDDVPLSYYIPPVHLSPPQIDPKNLNSIKELAFPENTIVDDNQITVPIHKASDVRAFFRGVFRINSGPTNPDKLKQRISLAFDGLKSLNELSQAIDDLKTKQKNHIDRDNVKFRVGQVVRHKEEEWRAVIVGWERIDLNETNKEEEATSTSLTKKSYPLDPSDNIKYMVILDSGDAHLHYAKRREGYNLSISDVFQSDLELVEDTSLLRIRSPHITEYFQRFEEKTNSFVPNEILAYEYPADNSPLLTTFQLSEQSEQASKDVISGVQDFSEYLRNIILGYTSAPESRDMKLLGLFLDRLTLLSKGDIIPVKERLAIDSTPSNKLASMHLQELLNLTINIGDLLWQKRRTSENEKELKFGLGDVVKHKLYGFRGVVVAWDPEPTLDVSRWDGLQHIKNPHEFPFYHIIPDQNDCIEAFGGERPSRYVCEENLEICSSDEKYLDVDLEPEWEFNSSKGVYHPPEDLKFKYGLPLDDDGMTERCLTEIKDSISQIFVASRDESESLSKNEDLDSISKRISLHNLLLLLKSAHDMETATIFSESLKEIWKAHLDNELRWKLDTAVGYLLSGKVSKALQNFSEVVDKDPSYAEAWNKASTCEFMMGNMDASLAAARKTIECSPTHFQALNGLGLVYYEKKDIASAVDCFRKSMAIDPWSPVAARLSVCLETLKLSEELENNKKNNG